VREHEAHADSGEEKRHEQQQVGRRKPHRLPGVPQELECVERQALRQQERSDRGQPEQRRAEREHPLQARLQPLAQQGDAGARRTVAEQRHADHHVGEVVPLDDREQPREQDLVRQGGGRHGRERQPERSPRDRRGVSRRHAGRR
jgi:hypothetical protein